MERLPERLAWARIDEDALADNFKHIGERVCGARICCVIKANAYGHGAGRLALLYGMLGADMLAVASLAEALTVREAGSTLPILILGPTPPALAEVLVRHHITQAVYSVRYGQALVNALYGTGMRLSVHIKIDTGMGRWGIRAHEAEMLLPLLARRELVPTGIFTHLSHTDSEDGGGHTEAQRTAFFETVSMLSASGMAFPLRHMANSAAIFEHPEAHLDMVRPGIALYGVPPCASAEGHLRPALTLCAAVAECKKLECGEALGYGGAFVAGRSTRAAFLPLGYADGIPRTAAEKGMRVMIKDKAAPIIGRVSMDMTVIDVTELDVSIGDVATVYGAAAPVSVAAHAAACGSLPHEILCGIGGRIPRLYIRKGE